MRVLSESIPIAETFYSVQGEGPTMGVPAVFLRASHCNLRCPAWGPPGSPQGCDTTDVWSKVWRYMTSEELLAYWDAQGWGKLLKHSDGVHLVLTGGEPMIWQVKLLHLLRLLTKESSRPPYVEVETNTTIYPEPLFDYHIRQYNCSPKLKSAGNPLEKALIPGVLRTFAHDPRAYFKFVVQHPSDIGEIIDDYVMKFDIPWDRVWLMPEGATRERLQQNSVWVTELAKAHGFRFSSRLQLVIYDKATGV